MQFIPPAALHVGSRLARVTKRACVELGVREQQTNDVACQDHSREHIFAWT